MGSIVLFTLVLLRVAGLLRQVQTQSALLEVIARSDALAGLPNRGPWDHQLVRVTDDARERGRQLTIALLAAKRAGRDTERVATPASGRETHTADRHDPAMT
jgi:hypothetical protein